MRWNTGGLVSTTTYSELESFLIDGKVTDRALQDAIRMSGWTAEEPVSYTHLRAHET